MTRKPAWDIFCTVVDNFGDIGVCWRLARQLAGEFGLPVRLWVDDLHSFRRLCPHIEPALNLQRVAGVDVCRWVQPFVPMEPADVVVEAFACHLPEAYVHAMAKRSPAPVWINLEYLTAEDWVRGCHLLSSPHPSFPLVKHFFFPGFLPGTGGLLAERGLSQCRNEFKRDIPGQNAFWNGLGVPPRKPGELRVSLFAYENPHVPALFDAWARGRQVVTCVVPEGRVVSDVARFFGRANLQSGDALQAGSLAVRVLSFIDQDAYDRLLWACDLNFVRGEDSFVRAQWAARPFIWHIYRQEADAHLTKLRAFLDLYCEELSREAATACRGLWESWNRGDTAEVPWEVFATSLKELDGHAGNWAERLLAKGDLAGHLVQFCADKV